MARRRLFGFAIYQLSVAGLVLCRYSQLGTWLDVFKDNLANFVVFGVPVIAWGLNLLRLSLQKDPDEFIGPVTLTVITPALAYFGIGGAAFAIATISYGGFMGVMWIRDSPSVIGIGTLLVLGGFAFWIRRKFRLVYGFLEVCTGLFVGTQFMLSKFDYQHNAFETMEVPDVLKGIVCAGVYLVVRGLDNIEVGLNQASGRAITERLGALVKVFH